MNIDEQKEQLRRAMKHDTQALDRVALQESSDMIVRNITMLPEYAAAKHILGYVALSDEPELAPLYDLALAAGKQVAFPVCLPDNTMHFHAVGIAWRTRLVSNRWHIGEPDMRICPPLEFDGTATIVLVPAIAFDKLGKRLGRGKGFYDRFLSVAPQYIRSIGVCFDHQVIEHLPVADHDLSVDRVVTPSGLY